LPPLWQTKTVLEPDIGGVRDMLHPIQAGRFVTTCGKSQGKEKDECEKYP
jgi:hypothetical protein